MHNIISTNSTATLRYLQGSPVSSPEYYKQIRAAFPNDDVYRFFAEPVVFDAGRKIAWSSSYPGKAVPYYNLPARQKSLAQDMLAEAVAKLMAAVDSFRDPSLLPIFKNCIEIPNEESIFLIDNGNSDIHVLVIQWGFIEDYPGAQRGVLNKFYNIPKVPMCFSVVSEDDMTPVAGETVVFRIKGQEFQAVSDESGSIVINDVRVGQFVEAFVSADIEHLSPLQFTCREGEKNIIKVAPKRNMEYIVVDQNGVPQPDATFFFEYSGQKISAVTNADGGITLEDIKQGVSVESYQLGETGEKMYDLTNVFDYKSNPYRIVITVTPPPPPEPAPRTSNLRIKVLDEKNNVVRNRKVTVRYLDKEEVMRSDDDGYVVIHDLPVGTKVEAIVK